MVHVMRQLNLFVSGFSPDFYPVYYNDFCFVIDSIKDTVIPNTDTVTFSIGKFFTTMWSWVIRKRKDCAINCRTILFRDIIGFFSRSFFYYNGIVQSFNQFLRNSSYGIKEVASFSALRRSIVSSKSSIISIIFLYSFKLSKTPFLVPFWSIRNFGFVFLKALFITNLVLQFCCYIFKNNTKRIYVQWRNIIRGLKTVKRYVPPLSGLNRT